MPANAKTQTPGQANAFDRKRRIKLLKKQQLAQEASELGMSVTELKSRKAEETLKSSQKTREQEERRVLRERDNFTRGYSFGFD